MVSGSGTCIVQYDQPGNATHNAAPQLTNSVTATTIASTTSIALTSGASTSNVGDSLTFSATVSGAAATPSGTVTFLDGVSSLGTFPLSSGFASVVTSALTAGSHSISVSYGGDGNYAGSTSLNLAQNVVATSLQAIYNSLLPATPTTQMDIFLLASAPLDLFSAGRDITVSIKGGYADTGHTELNRTVTTIQGPTFVTAGKVVMENIAVK